MHHVSTCSTWKTGFSVGRRLDLTILFREEVAERSHLCQNLVDDHEKEVPYIDTHELQLGGQVWIVLHMTC